MRRRLIVMRHAKSEWPDGVPDHERGLAGRGRREATLAGRWLREQVPELGLVVCSSAVRARRTWKRVGAQLAAGPALRVDERLYAATNRQLVEVVRELPSAARSVLMIGHNPGLEDLVAHLTGVWCPLKTSSIAVLSSRSGWADAGFRWARLDRSVTPRP